MYRQYEKICLCCGQKYIGDKNRKYCGYKCAKKARERRINKVCPICSREYYIQDWQETINKTCSKKCKVIMESASVIETTCDNCNSKFTRLEYKLNGKNKFCCKSCANEFNRGPNHYEYKEFLHDKHIIEALKQWGRSIKMRDKYVCQKCGETNSEILQAHHITHRSKDIKRQFDFDNGITLCLRCHMKEHEDDEKTHRLIEYKYKEYLKNKDGNNTH